MFKRSMMKHLVAATCFMFLFPGTASAYLDPGTGSMLLQLLMGGVAGIVVILKLYWERITGLFRRKKPQVEPPRAEQDQ